MLSKETKLAVAKEGDALYDECLKHIPNRVPENTSFEKQVANTAKAAAGSRVQLDSTHLIFHVKAVGLANQRLSEMQLKYGSESSFLLRGVADLIEYRLRAAAQAVMNKMMRDYDVHISISESPTAGWIRHRSFLVVSTKQEDELEAARQKLTEAFSAIESALKKHRSE